MKIKETVSFLKKNKISNVDIAIILGTGLDGLIKNIDIIKEIPYNDIPNFPLSTVEFHKGKLIFGKISKKNILAFQGRFHYYEGYSAKDIAFPVNILKFLNTKFLLISNAAGTMNKNFRKGELMLIKDHINLIPDNPLRGKNDDSLGPRFPDMSQAYSKYLNSILKNIASANNIKLNEGVYVAVAGPNLETPAEYKFLRKIGADAVGMSTVPEVIAANHIQLPCCAISVLTDECYPENLKPVDIEDIIKTAAKAEPKLTFLYTELIKKL